MNKTQKTWLGILSFLPLLLSFIIAFLVIKNFVGLFGLALADAPAEVAGSYILKDYAVIVLFAVFTNFLNLVQMIIFIILAVKNAGLQSSTRILYIVFLVIFTNITAIVYFILEVSSSKDKNMGNWE